VSFQEPRPGVPAPRTPDVADVADVQDVPDLPDDGPARVGPTRIEAAIGRGFERVMYTALGPYQSAVVRIGFALAWLGFLLREYPHRQELYGPDGPWSFDLGKRLVGMNHAFTALTWTRSDAWFEFVYAFAVVSAALLLVGWRTRTMSVLFMIGVLSLENRSVFMGDGGDNIIHLMAIYLVLVRCGQVWSLDARRRARIRRRLESGEYAPLVERDITGVCLWAVMGASLVAVTAVGVLSTRWLVVFWALLLLQAGWWALGRWAPGEPRAVADVLANLVHNAGLLIIMVQVCLVYATAGWYKVQGSRWQDGTALHYPLHLDYFTPWPALAEVLGGSGTMVMVITYGTVIVQVAFPFTVFNRRIKNVLLAVMILEHVSIAVILGLPFFSLAMISADAVFLPTVFLVWAGARVTGGYRRLLGRRHGPRGPAAGERPEQVLPRGA
jgi:hypothetical protein